MSKNMGAITQREQGHFLSRSRHEPVGFPQRSTCPACGLKVCKTRRACSREKQRMFQRGEL